MTGDAARFYDDYWRSRDVPRTRARSESRAALAIALLRRHPPAGAAPRDGSLRLLELGCGPGFALERFAAAGFDARGIDVSPEAVAAARARGLRVEAAGLGDPLPPGPHDVIALLEVLEHLVDPLAVLSRARLVLAPGGRLLVSLPNELHLLRRLAVLAGRPGFGGHDDPHLRHFDDHHARRLFAAADLRVIARASDPLAPPRRRALRALLRPAARLLPGLLAISNVYLLEPRDGAGAVEL